MAILHGEQYEDGAWMGEGMKRMNVLHDHPVSAESLSLCSRLDIAHLYAICIYIQL
jgi:hypothetical protein